MQEENVNKAQKQVRIPNLLLTFSTRNKDEIRMSKMNKMIILQWF